MLTVEDLELACDTGLPLDFSRHVIDIPKPTLWHTFYPLGFPAEVRTNSAGILEIVHDLWGRFHQESNADPILVHVNVGGSDMEECPPAPTYRWTAPLLTAVSNANNFMVCDLARGRTDLTVSSTTEKQKLFLRYFFLEAIAGCHLAWRHATPVHGACVALNGRGVLLLGDSGAGKSSLAFACARAGWTYVSDDAAFLLHGGIGGIVTGNCHLVRLRPTAAELFPEVAGRETTPRAAGKPSIEILTASLKQFQCSQTARVDFLVFLNRRSGWSPELVRYRKDVARHFMRQLVYGSPQSLIRQYEEIDRLLEVEVFELRYSELGWATERLHRLVRENENALPTIQQSNDYAMTKP